MTRRRLRPRHHQRSETGNEQEMASTASGRRHSGRNGSPSHRGRHHGAARRWGPLPLPSCSRCCASFAAAPAAAAATRCPTSRTRSGTSWRPGSRSWGAGRRSGASPRGASSAAAGSGARAWRGPASRRGGGAVRRPAAPLSSRRRCVPEKCRRGGTPRSARSALQGRPRPFSPRRPAAVGHLAEVMLARHRNLGIRQGTVKQSTRWQRLDLLTLGPDGMTEFLG